METYMMWELGESFMIIPLRRLVGSEGCVSAAYQNIVAAPHVWPIPPWIWTDHLGDDGGTLLRRTWIAAISLGVSCPAYAG